MCSERNAITIRASAAEYPPFITVTGESDVNAIYADENARLTQKMMSVLYDVDVRTINDHLKKIHSDKEIAKDSTIRKFRIVQKEGFREVSREVLHYDLHARTAVDFKVNSERAVLFSSSI